jgi:glycosyltransferase involved in cell wall biosynthesis
LVTIPAWRFNSWGNVGRIARILRQYKPDAVLFNIQFATFGSGKLAGGLGLLAPWVSKLLGFPTIVLLHNILETVDLKSAGFSDSPLTHALIRFSGTILTRLLLAVDRVALTIPKYVEIIRAKYHARNVLLIPHGTFDDIAKPNLDLPAGPQQVMTFGKFGTYKKVETLIEAFQLLQTRPDQSPLELVIAGTDSPNAPGYLAKAAQTYAHVPNVRFTGYVAEDQVPVIFGEAAVVVFPYTSTTGSSGVLHQAGSFGKAVVLPHIGDFVELISEEGYAAEIFEPEEVQSLADAIARVLDAPEHRQQLGLQNYLAARGVPIAEVADWYLLHFRQLIQPKKKTPAQSRRVVSNQPGKA